MKILSVYDEKTGEVISTQYPCESSYNLFLNDIDIENIIIIGIELETKRLITLPKNSSNLLVLQKRDELFKTNELYVLKNNVSDLTEKNKELNTNLNTRLETLEASTVEIMENIYET